jgi:phenylacetate-CoA ligase
VYFSAYHISSTTASNYLEGIKKYKIEYMTGYAMSNYFLAKFIEENGLIAPKLKAVITSSEKLTPIMRDTFKRVYGCKTFDGYSGVEASCMITECEYGSLHISPDVGIIEILKEDGNNAMPGETGQIICTGFLNYDQPLLRYQIGDLVTLNKSQTCLCGRQMPIIEEIVGRLEDIVIGADGRQMVRFHGIFLNIPSIEEGQIIQHTVTEFEIKVVLSKPLTNEETQTIHKRMESQLGTIKLSINQVDYIPRAKSGKFKAVISHVKK